MAALINFTAPAYTTRNNCPRMTEGPVLLQLIKLKVQEVNASMHDMDLLLHADSVAKRAAYRAATQQAARPVRWLRYFSTPKVRQPFWLQLDMVSCLEAALNRHPTSWKDLSAQLNLFVLNTAIEITRLKATGPAPGQVNELRLLSEQAREFANRETWRPNEAG